MQQQQEQEHSGYAEGDLTAFEDEHQIAAVMSEMNKRCANGVSRIKLKNREYATKVTDVVETCMRDRNVIGEGKTRIKNETEVMSRCSRRNRVTTSEKKSRIMDNLTEAEDPAREIQYWHC